MTLHQTLHTFQDRTPWAALGAAFEAPQSLTEPSWCQEPQGQTGRLTGGPGGLRTPASGRAHWDNRAGAVEGSSGLRLGKKKALSNMTGELS